MRGVQRHGQPDVQRVVPDDRRWQYRRRDVQGRLLGPAAAAVSQQRDVVRRAAAQPMRLYVNRGMGGRTRTRAGTLQDREKSVRIGFELCERRLTRCGAVALHAQSRHARRCRPTTTPTGASARPVCTPRARATAAGTARRSGCATSTDGAPSPVHASVRRTDPKRMNGERQRPAARPNPDPLFSSPSQNTFARR